MNSITVPTTALQRFDPPLLLSMPTLATQKLAASKDNNPFPGFEQLTANFIYCPNQFFDVCLKNSSRNIVRVVAYFLRRTLGWLDGNGNPVEQNISVSYRELIADAGISRGAIRTALGDAVAAGFITCTQRGRPKAVGQQAQSARYMLRWDTENEYTTDASMFNGFYTGEGHRTPIPNAFFDHVVRRERLAVAKVVGTVLRHTVGYQNQFGGRRSQAPLSYSYIQQWARLRDRTTLSDAIHDAITIGYIQRVSQGVFAPHCANRRPAVYTVKWLAEAGCREDGSKTRPAASNRFKTPTSIGSKTPPVGRFNNPTKERTERKNTFKQQAAAENREGLSLLLKTGFDEATATELSRKRGLVEIQQQIEWLTQRNAKRNPLGMLRRAIEEQWSEPSIITTKQQKPPLGERYHRQHAEQATQNAKSSARRSQRTVRRQRLLKGWNSLSQQEREELRATAIQQTESHADRQQFRSSDLENPPTMLLELIAEHLSVAVGD